MAREIIQGEPGSTWTNDTGRVRYQFIAALINTCGSCLQYHLQIGGWWPIPLHHNCRCRQVPIAPGAAAPEPFADFRKILDDMSYKDQMTAIGASNYALLKNKIVTWGEIVTKYRVRTLREVISLNKVSLKTAIKAGVPKRAYVAWDEAFSTEANATRAHRAHLIENIKGAGVSQDALVDALTRGLVSRVELVAPLVKQSMVPFVAARGRDLLAAELAAIAAEHAARAASRPRPPEPPEEPPPAAPSPAPLPPHSPTPAAPVEPPVKKPKEPAPAFEDHDMGESRATVVVERTAAENARKIFGKDVDPQRLASLAGAPDDAAVLVRADGDKIELNVDHPMIESMQRTIRKNPNGKIVIHNDIFKIKKCAPAIRRKTGPACLCPRGPIRSGNGCGPHRDACLPRQGID